MFTQQVVNGVVLGCIYGLNALGFTMIFGVIRLINLAQIDMAMVGGFCGLAVVQLMAALGFVSGPVTVAACLVLGMAATGLLGVVIERLAFRPLRHSPPIFGLTTSLGISLILQNTAMLALGSEIKVFPRLFPATGFRLGNAQITLLQVFIVAVSLALMFGLYLFVNRTRMGRAMRATAENAKVAQLMGIDPNRVIALTFFIAGGLGAAAGLLMAMYFGVVKYDMGLLPGIKGFSGAILGGMGSIPGAVLGGFIIGVVENLCGGYISTTYKDIFAFLVLILVLVVKPSGLLGRKSR